MPSNERMMGNLASKIIPVGSFGSSGIEVLVVGAGLAGISAAIECFRKGHAVKIFERNDSVNTAGDIFFLGRSATYFFKHWPEMAKEYEEISMHNGWIHTLKHDGETLIKPMRMADRAKLAGFDPDHPPGRFQLRPLVHQMLLRQMARLGIKIEFNKRVIDYFEAEGAGKAGVITDDGECYLADVVVAADGVGSRSQRIVGGQVRAMNSGRAMWRAAFPIRALDKNPEVRESFGLINGIDPVVRVWLGPATYALTLTRADKIVWVMNHDADLSSSESWSNTIDASEVLSGMDKIPGPTKWAPIFKDLIACTPPSSIIDFSLLWRNPQPSWTSPGARVIQIGDAAHSFLPASGNGATQALEDAVSLASCLHLAATKDGIPDAVRAHVRMRFVRTACAQKLGFASAEVMQNNDLEKLKVDPKKAQPKQPRWIWEHDPEQYAYETFDGYIDAVGKGVEVGRESEVCGVRENYPPGYRYEPWSIEDIAEDKRMGREVYLGTGEWL